MDYDWKYYIDDLMAGRSHIAITESDRKGAVELDERMGADTKRQAARITRTMLSRHRQQGSAENALIDDAMRQHTAYCQSLADDEMLKRRHNALVYRHMIKTALHNRAVGGKLGVSKDTVANDLRTGLNELLVILFGVPALQDSEKNGAVKTILENYRLLQYCKEITQSFSWGEWEEKKSTGNRITSNVIQSIEKAIMLYEEYCDGCELQKDTAARSLYVVKAVYIDTERKTVDDIATEWGCSPETVYSDLKKATDRLSEIIGYMAAGYKASRGFE